ncbi:acyloxyacyl hydrolase [Actomonas aquatica]|uniref:Acyloxyacyl hydrolase n=1 Tax=Actomonas aquatica TaxID=2866162 RepID=A0ABZ1C3N6_9BACT|nr:acyloxyacyl hydrolase [Opitutus sp. WL0086]WRQ86294.1 acyloxyacyl hydrolase [Opitutus sp. WL0086]
MTALPKTSLRSLFVLLLLSTLSAAPAAAAIRTAAPDTESYTLVARFGMLGVLDDEPADPLAALELRFPQQWHGIHPYVSLNLTDSRTWFAGAGLIYHLELSPNYRLTLGSGPFYYQHEPDRDLGLKLEFYSFAELTRELPRNQRLGLRIGHLSNAGLGRHNPGAETVSIVYSRPLGSLRSLWAGSASDAADRHAWRP